MLVFAFMFVCEDERVDSDDGPAVLLLGKFAGREYGLKAFGTEALEASTGFAGKGWTSCLGVGLEVDTEGEDAVRPESLARIVVSGSGVGVIEVVLPEGRAVLEVGFEDFEL